MLLWHECVCCGTSLPAVGAICCALRGASIYCRVCLRNLGCAPWRRPVSWGRELCLWGESMCWTESLCAVAHLGLGDRLCSVRSTFRPWGESLCYGGFSLCFAGCLRDLGRDWVLQAKCVSFGAGLCPVLLVCVSWSKSVCRSTARVSLCVGCQAMS